MNKSASEDYGLMQRETDYNLNLIILKKLLQSDLITQNEYEELDTMLKQKYAPTLSEFISDTKPK